MSRIRSPSPAQKVYIINEMSNPDSISFQIATVLFGFLALATTYLPTPIDNLSYLFIILFMFCLVYSLITFQKKSKSYKQHSYTKAASTSTKISIAVIIFIIAVFIIKFLVG